MNDPVSKIQNSFSQQHANNAKTQKNIENINLLLTQQQNIDEIIDTLKNWQEEPHLQIQNYTFWLFIAIAVICAILAIAIHPTFIIMTILSVGFAFYKRTSTKALKELLNHLQQRKLEQQYQIRYFANDQDLRLESPYHFPLFGLGNHANEIRNTVYGNWKINDSTYTYMLFNYHYVDKEESRDSDGKTKTEFEHHDLWGIILENFPTRGISISSRQKSNCRLGVKWSSGDIRFDQQFQISGVNEIELAKFFTPSHILQLESNMQPFNGDFYVQALKPSLCWLFDVDLFEEKSDLSNINNINDLVIQLESLHMPNYERLRQSLFNILEEIQPHYHQ